MPHASRYFVVMGVCGVGKTTIARALADRFSGSFVEADRYHPEENIRSMSAGIPLTDAMRRGWLEDTAAAARRARPRPVFVACSVLKNRYRDRFRARLSDVAFIYLYGTKELLSGRLADRTGHFVPVSLLDSQLSDLEAPDLERENGIAIDVAMPIAEVVDQAAAFCSSARQAPAK